MPTRDYPPGQLVPGTVYKVLRHIATGGMGTVYDVEDTTVGKRYVLKTLHPELGDRQDLARRMIKEARTLAQLHHPNIVEVFTAGMTKDELRLPYYVMERLDGQSLRTVLDKRKSLEVLHAYEIAIDLLDALDCAHDKQVIHRDVKPDNIFLHRAANGATVTKLLDFGIMRVLDGAKGETAGRFLGTLRYAAPEQLRSQNMGPHTDVYAAGLVLYEMICGRGPFDDERDVQQIGKAHLTKPPPPLSRLARVPVAPELEALVASALAKEPAARPRDAFTFAKELRALAQAARAPAPVSASATSRPTAVNVLAIDARAEAPTTRDVGEAAGTLPAAPGGSIAGTAAGMMPPTVRGGTLEDAPRSVGPTLASPAHGAHAAHPAPASAGPGVDRRAATRSYVYDAPDAPARAPQNGTEAITPPIAVTMSADPFGMTQRALEPVPSAPPMQTASSWQFGDARGDATGAPPRSGRGATTTPSSRARSAVGLVAAAIALLSIAGTSLLFIAHRARVTAAREPAAAPPAPPPSSAASAAPLAPAAVALAAPSPTSAATGAAPLPASDAGAPPAASSASPASARPAPSPRRSSAPGAPKREPNAPPAPPAPQGRGDVAPPSALPRVLPGSGL